MAATATSSIVDHFHGAARIDRLIATDAATKILSTTEKKIFMLTVFRLSAEDAGKSILRESERQRFYWQTKK